MAKRTAARRAKRPAPDVPTFRGPTAAQADGTPPVEIPENAAALTAVRSLAGYEPPAENRAETPSAPGLRRYLYGPSGCGNTRLVDELLRLDRSTAGATTAAQRKAAGVVRYTGARLTAALDEALAGGFAGPLRESLLSARLLIVEDLAGLRAKPKTQELLLAGLDAVEQTGGRALLTGPDLPGGLPDVSQRLLDRLRGGVCVGVAAPSKESAGVLLRHFAERQGVRATPPAVRMLADGFAGASIRELEAAAERMRELARTAGTTGWTAEIAAALLAGRAETDAALPSLSLSAVSRAVAKRFGLKVGQLREPGRSAAVVPARQAGMALCRELTGEPLVTVARHFGRTDHGTVMYALKRFRERAEQDAAFRGHVAA
ncbi:MAG: helix-turn-helix domain-containing protein, partial [Planctomycetota bacterium]